MSTTDKTPSTDTGAGASSSSSSGTTKTRFAAVVEPDSFEAENHFYARTLNAQVHPMVSSFFNLGNERIINRFSHLNPQVDVDTLRTLLDTHCKFFNWAGSDLFNVTDSKGTRNTVLIETNSCPSGQKSMPLLLETNEEGGYGSLMESAYKAQLDKSDLSLGGLAVIYDKNPMEASGYAATIATMTDEKVYLAEFYETDKNPPVRWTKDRVLEVRDKDGEWHSIRLCFRYVTQKPWNRIPIQTKTIVMNPLLTCLAGGRNKMMSDKSADFLNGELQGTGLAIRMPETIREVRKNEIPLYVARMGGHAVVKVPYSNAGQGVFTITSEADLEEFMGTNFDYDKYIVQSLVGNHSWSSEQTKGKFFHVGTIPNKKNLSYVADLRMMVASTQEGFRPIAVYARRAAKPLIKDLEDNPGYSSWDMLGTNLSYKDENGKWATDTNRLLLMDRKDFNKLGIGIDDLIDAYIQTVLSVVSIDRMCVNMVNDDGSLNEDLFLSLNADDALLREIKQSESLLGNHPSQKEEAGEEEAAE